MTEPIPYSTDPQDIAVRIEAGLRNPNIGRVMTTQIRAGPQTYRWATLYEIMDPKTDSHHHYALRIDTYKRTKAHGWELKPDRCLSLGDDTSDELGRLSTLLASALGGSLPAETGEYRVLGSKEFDSLRDVLRVVRQANSPRKLKYLRAILSSMELDSVAAIDWLRMFEGGAQRVNETVAAAARLVEYSKAREELALLIADAESSEQELQQLLAQQPWMFGSEYSELISRRTWTRDDRLDFMLRRTVDDYLEIVEIKTPMRAPLFRFDSSRDSYSPAAHLSVALGQVIRYIEEVERGRDAILAKDGVDSLKIRARLIIGRSGGPEQTAALRNLNGHLHRIEVLTFDQLLRITDRVLSVFKLIVETSPSITAEFEEFPSDFSE